MLYCAAPRRERAAAGRPGVGTVTTRLAERQPFADVGKGKDGWPTVAREQSPKALPSAQNTKVRSASGTGGISTMPLSLRIEAVAVQPTGTRIRPARGVDSG